MHPYQKMKTRQLAVLRANRPAPRPEPKRVRLLLTKLGLAQGIALWVALGILGSPWTGTAILAVPCSFLGGLVLDAVRST